MLLIVIAHFQVAKGRRVAVPADGMTAGPITPRNRSRVERHANPIAGVEARAPHFREGPPRAQVPRAPFDIGLEPACGQYHGLAIYHMCASIVAQTHAPAAAVVGPPEARCP